MRGHECTVKAATPKDAAMKPKPRLTTAADLLTLAVGFVRCASPLTVLERLGYLPLPRATMDVEMGVRLNVVI
jgi:hypothetical protein